MLAIGAEATDAIETAGAGAGVLAIGAEGTDAIETAGAGAGVGAVVGVATVVSTEMPTDGVVGAGACVVGTEVTIVVEPTEASDGWVGAGDVAGPFTTTGSIDGRSADGPSAKANPPIVTPPSAPPMATFHCSGSERVPGLWGIIMMSFRVRTACVAVVSVLASVDETRLSRR